MGMQAYPITEPAAIPDHHTRPHMGVGTHGHIFSHRGGRMDSAGRRQWWCEERQHPGQGQVRVLNTDDIPAGQIFTGNRKKSAGRGPLRRLGVAGVGQKRQVVRTGSIQRRHGLHPPLRITAHLATHMSGNLGQRPAHAGPRAQFPSPAPAAAGYFSLKRLTTC